MIMENMKYYVINGGWALFLRTSRFAGVAPVKLVKYRNGYNVCVSQRYAIYSKILMTLINCAGIIGIIINFLKNGSQIDFRRTLFWASHNMIITSIITLIGSYNGALRMKNMIEYLSILKKVETNINLVSATPTKSFGIRKATLLLYCTTFSLTLMHSLIGYSILVYKYALGKLLFFVHEFVFIAKFYLELQIMYLALKTFAALKLLNQELEGMLCIKGIAKAKEISIKIRTLTRSYVSICDVALRLNKDDGFVMFLILVDIIHSLILNGYHMFYGQPGRNWFYYMAFIICIFNIIKIVIFIENYHRISREATNTRVILSKLIYHLTGVGQRISIDLELMFKQLILITPQFSPLGIFGLQRSNIMTIFSVVSTCAVYLVQINVNDNNN